LRGIETERFVDDDRNSGLDAGQRARRVLIVRRGDDYEIESAGVEHLVETGVYDHSRMAGGGLGLPLRVTGHHRRHAHAGLGPDQLPVKDLTGEAIPDDPHSKSAHQADQPPHLAPVTSRDPDRHPG
jgi:hypothetical protein